MNPRKYRPSPSSSTLLLTSSLLPHPPSQPRPILSDSPFSQTLENPKYTPNSVFGQGGRVGERGDIAGKCIKLKGKIIAKRGKRLLFLKETREPVSTTRAGTAVPRTNSNLSDVTEIMKKMFQMMPDFAYPKDENEQLNRSMVTRRSKMRENDRISMSFYSDPVSIYAKSSGKPPISKRKTGFEVARIASNRENRPKSEKKVAKLEEFLIEFHKKSRELLGQLEKNVLGSVPPD